LNFGNPLVGVYLADLLLDGGSKRERIAGGAYDKRRERKRLLGVRQEEARIGPGVKLAVTNICHDTDDLYFTRVVPGYGDTLAQRILVGEEHARGGLV
jgi:hypothetical protein